MTGDIMRTYKTIMLSLFFIGCISCSASKDIGGTYKKISGDYRYDTFVIEKNDGNKYSITVLNDGEKKLSATSEFDKGTLKLGWLATLTFKNGDEFILNLAKPSVFKKKGAIEKTGKE